MKARFNQKFGELLAQAVHSVKAHENRDINVVDDELGYDLGYKGGSIFGYWRRGHVPKDPEITVKLARYYVEHGKMDREWTHQFLDYGGVPERDLFFMELFPKETLESPSPSNNQQIQAEEQEWVNRSPEKVTELIRKNLKIRWVLLAIGVVLLMAVFSFLPSFDEKGRQGQSPTQSSPNGQIQLTNGIPTITFSAPPTAIPFKITDITFDPLPPAKTDRVKIFACTQGQGGVGISLRVSVNTAPDGSDNGDRIMYKELGVPCFNQDDAPVWDTTGWKPGTYQIKIEAKTADDPEWRRPEVVNVPYTLR